MILEAEQELEPEPELSTEKTPLKFLKESINEIKNGEKNINEQIL